MVVGLEVFFSHIFHSFRINLGYRIESPMQEIEIINFRFTQDSFNVAVHRTPIYYFFYYFLHYYGNSIGTIEMSHS